MRCMPILKMPSKNIYVFGNPLLEEDSLAIKLAERLQKEKAFGRLNFVYLDGTEEIYEENMILLDVAKNIKGIQIITNLDQLYAGKFYTMHDADIALFLKLMQKIGKIQGIKIIAIPFDMNEKVAYTGLKKILRTI